MGQFTVLEHQLLQVARVLFESFGQLDDGLVADFV